MRRLPQFEVGPLLLVRSGLAGLAISGVIWFFVSYIPYLRFFLAILVGVAVGEVMSRLARRRSNRVLEAIAVVDIVAGLLVVDIVQFGLGYGAYLTRAGGSISIVLGLLVPAAIASYIAIVKLR